MRQAFDIHTGAFTEMHELIHQLCGAGRIHAIQKARTAAGLLFREGFCATWTRTWQYRRSAAGKVLSKLGYDLICLVELYPVADSQLEALDNVKVMEIGPIDRRAVNDHILKLAGDGYHAGAGSGQFKAEELAFIQRIRPFEGHNAVFVMACCA